MILSDETRNAVRKANLSKISGPDGVCNEIRGSLSDPLTEIFNNILSTSEIPERWEISDVIRSLKTETKPI